MLWTGFYYFVSLLLGTFNKPSDFYKQFISATMARWLILWLYPALLVLCYFPWYDDVEQETRIQIAIQCRTWRSLGAA